ncbi:MAG: hypothetical protein D8M62_10495 [Proteobacteria bacterium]|nr:hypothetical protein [Pseudomonadota bacterium]
MDKKKGAVKAPIISRGGGDILLKISAYAVPCRIFSLKTIRYVFNGDFAYLPAMSKRQCFDE